MRRVEITLNEARSCGGAATSTLRNEQAAAEEVTLQDDAVVGASWRMHQTYTYGASDDGCYLRNVCSVGYDVLFASTLTSTSSWAATGGGRRGGGGPRGRRVFWEPNVLPKNGERERCFWTPKR